MYDTYTQVLAVGKAKQARQHALEAKKIIAELADQKDQALSNKDAWKVHYFGLEAERDYLLKLLDEAHGGPENNPARQTASDKIRIPNGPRKGEFIQARDRIYLAGLKSAISERASYLGSWKDLISKIRIFE
jgi:hypothetical protein